MVNLDQLGLLEVLDTHQQEKLIVTLEALYPLTEREAVRKAVSAISFAASALSKIRSKYFELFHKTRS